MSEVITIGEPLVILASKDMDKKLEDVKTFQRLLGGAELNVSIGISRLGHSVQYISQVGDDPFGKYVKKEINGHNVGTDYILEDNEHWTGHQIKQLVSSGDPDTYNYRKNSAASYLNADIVDKIDLSDVKFAHMSGIFPAISATAEDTFRKLFKKLIANNVKTTFDPNLRPQLWASEDVMRKTINDLAGMANIVLPGINEGKILMGSSEPEEIADFYLKGEQTETVIVKVGPDGAFVKNKNGETFTVRGFKVDHVVDTVGAGDGFALGVISALLENKSLKSAILRGNAVGALQVQTPGDNDGYPTPDELKAFYEKESVSE
ncbi:sugar kinase [Companilactobacillus keshanensis]|uniref:Sugar kinase n=1 Tax=Companilactobacillus keshanensis TaxID=2486003 RepID=A0ABW4BTM4_9LACO|nr:sugar kinase [Companilactobacillus keshanensis]